MAVLQRVVLDAKVPDLCRKLGLTSGTLYKSRTKFGRMDVSTMARYHGRAFMRGRPDSRGLFSQHIAKGDSQNELTAMWLVALTDNNRHWGFELLYPNLRMVKVLHRTTSRSIEFSATIG